MSLFEPQLGGDPVSAKLRIKARGIEIEWEGDVEYLKNDLPSLIAKIVAALGVGSEGSDDDDNEADKTLEQKTFTTVALAAKAKPKTAPALFKVALAKLQVSDGQSSASLAAILDEMKKATIYWKPAIPNNIAKNIQSLLEKGDINEPASGHYVLSQDEADRLQALINS